MNLTDNERQKEVRGKILAALKNTKYKIGRTINGIAKETSLSKKEVKFALTTDTILREEIKVYPRKRTDGKSLITTKKKYDKESTLRDKFVDVFATKRSSFESDSSD